ncbi:fungal-specific transcription factor domain-containing protein [Mycena latifolia]|nr:fungal-specific transcription factor domain-containing protein [Mycena latifolia]
MKIHPREYLERRTNASSVHATCADGKNDATPGNGKDPCSLCVKLNHTCVYKMHPSQATSNFVEPGPHPSKQDVEDLEMRLQIAESLLEETIIGNPSESLGVQLALRAIRGLQRPGTAPHPDDLAFAEIEACLQARDLSKHCTGSRGFHGKSSGFMLIKTAIDLTERKAVALGFTPSGSRQPIPSGIRSWKARVPAVNYSFPEEDLLRALVALYFDNVNAFLPLLHRPSFERDVHKHLHETNEGFTKIVLLVCAIGARYSTDPRVSSSTMDHAGWDWFGQVKLGGHLMQRFATLHDIQAYCLTVEYLDATANPRISWNAVGLGLRAGQDIGMHRFNMYASASTFDLELERRASWILLLFDTQIGTALGRGSTLESHEFELRMPVVCDDDYWNSPDAGPHRMFRQPPGKPSVVAFFNCMINLNRILALSCKLLYSSDRKNLEVGLEDNGWQERVVRALDSALNAWLDTIPAHLRWDPDCLILEDTFFDQSAALYCMYYHTRIVIHRRCISAVSHASDPTSVTSLEICSTAARACSRVADVQHRRHPDNPLWFSKIPLFTSGVVLFMNACGSRNLIDRRQDLDDFGRCVFVLSAQRQQWPSVSPLLDMLENLIAPQCTSRSSHAVPGSPFIDENVPDTLAPPQYNPELETLPQLWFPVDVLPLGQITGTSSPGGGSQREFNFTQEAGSDDLGSSVHNNRNQHTEKMSRATAGFGVAEWETYVGSLVTSDEGRPPLP